MSLLTNVTDLIASAFAKRQANEQAYQNDISGSLQILADYEVAQADAAAARKPTPPEPKRLAFALELLAFCGLPEADIRKKVELAKKRIMSKRKAAELEQREAKLAEIQQRRDDKFAELCAARERLGSEIVRLDEQIFLATRERDVCLEARDFVNTTAPVSGEFQKLQRQLVGTDRTDASGFTLLGHEDGLMDRVQKLKTALDPRGFKGGPNDAIRCDEYPAACIADCDREIARLRKEAGPLSPDRIAALERRKAVAEGHVKLKTVELATLQRQADELRQKQAAMVEVAENL